MIIKIQKSRFFKFLSVFIAINFLIEIFNPIAVFALTSGPAQPEFESFAPIDATNMVDLASGDFSYNLPLMTVPGPNGGYPLNLAYNAGIGMEQEASWVGLGWNLNTGCISRQLRGLPDDFSGDKVTKAYSTRANWSLSMNCNLTGWEFLSFDFAKLLNISATTGFLADYNSYSGIKLQPQLNVQLKTNSFFTGLDTAGLGHLTDSIAKDMVSQSNGIRNKDDKPVKKASHALAHKILVDKSDKIGTDKKHRFASKTNTDKYILCGKDKAHRLCLKGDKHIAPLVGWAGAIHQVPDVGVPMQNFAARVNVKFGKESSTVFSEQEVSVYYARQAVAEKERSLCSYGTAYLHKSQNKGQVLRDFSLEKESVVSKYTVNLPVPALNNDVYVISGQGTGGVFRAYRSDLGVMEKDNISNNKTDIGVGLEFGMLNDIKFGLNYSATIIDQYSGKWQSGFGDVSDVLKFEGTDSVNRPAYEPFTFRMMGEPVIMNDDARYKELGYSKDVRFKTTRSGLNPVVEGCNLQTGTSYTEFTQNKRTERLPAISQIQFRTFKEIKDDGNYEYPYDDIASNSNCQNHHIGEYTIINPDGIKYTYAKAAYNTLQKEVMFSVDNCCSVSNKLINYNTSAATKENDQGRDHLYTATTLPPYTHSHLLTSITSADYIDNGNVGPSSGDYGYWVEFIYKDGGLYNWRAPFNDAIYSRGNESDAGDDRASYSYGTKELLYLDTIKTKTHFAVFHLSNRRDGRGAYNEHQTDTGGAYQQCLDSISLYSYSRPNTPIKVAHFRYSYGLCEGIPNYTIYGQGKLTLKKVWFTYGNNNKGRLSPYEFDYHESNADENPDYSNMNIDRWGTYCHDLKNVQNPYVNQDDADLDYYAGAWSLKEIKLPSGGNIEINYEMDDYAYVQNTKATRMFKITGVGSYDGEKLKHDELKVFFDPGTGVTFTCDDEVREYANGLKNDFVYFKVYMRLTENNRKDYVSGYAKVHDAGLESGKPYIELEAVEHKKTGWIHPFRLAGFSHLFSQRPDLTSPSINGNASFKDIIISVFGDVIDNVAKYLDEFRYYKTMGYCKKIVHDEDNFPGYIRLVEADMIKKGGGHRVSSVTLSDNWTKSASSSYKTTYDYRIVNKNNTIEDQIISSGVAEYEPALGGEENALKIPAYYKNDAFVTQDNKLYLEEPFGESYFPSPNVKYRQVIVSSETPSNVTKSASGKSVHKFYTAYEFPIKVAKDNFVNNSADCSLPMKFIPFLNIKIYNAIALSQAYKIELNDMHGKPRSVAAFPHGIDVLNPDNEGQTVTYQEYIYHTENGNQLKNKVNVFRGDKQYKDELMALNYDFITYANENKINIYNQATDSNLDIIVAITTFLPMLLCMFSGEDSQVRTLVTNKVIYRSGIIKETVSKKDGITVHTRHLGYDAYTGQPVLSIIDNTFEAPVYSYNFPAHWNYDGMGASYSNYRLKYRGTIDALTNKQLVEYFHVNDIVKIGNNNSYIITDIEIDPAIGNRILLSDPSGVPGNIFTNDESQSLDYYIVKQGYKNHLNSSSGNIVSLSNPVTERKFPLFDTLPEFGLSGTSDVYSFRSCDNQSGNVRICLDKTGFNDELSFLLNPTNAQCDGESDCICRASIIFDGHHALLDDIDDIDSLKKTGYKVNVYIGNGNFITGDWQDETGCFSECLDDVLNASASEYVQYMPTTKDYYWRNYLNNAYRIPRKQQGTVGHKTNLSKDGVYDYFKLFNWIPGNSDNSQQPWRWGSKATLYTNSGFELENIDALGIFSSAIYGYDDALATAVAGNARYSEMLFDGFDDYNLTTGISKLEYDNWNIYPVSGSLEIKDNMSHTGEKCLYLDDQDLTWSINHVTNFSLNNTIEKKLLANKKYLLSLWVNLSSGDISSVRIKQGSTDITTRRAGKIEGWQLVEALIETPSGNGNITVTIEGIDGYVDDIRLLPYNGSMKSYVYNPATLWLTAELDENNYATFYNYDEEGVLVQLKKETEEGIKTIATTRQNLKR
ncbi:MAG: hypothetical protein K9J13_09535 [Saprospiraceae bacterium]|nr:hypothetical protein [Saprospiraceae bacterium]